MFVMLTVLHIIMSGVVNAKYNSIDVEGKIYCPCGCGEILANCHCETATNLRSEISKSLLEGKTPEELVNKYVTMYGSTILVNQELETIKDTSKRGSQSMLPFYIIGIAITGFIAYNIGKSRKNEGKIRKKGGKNGDWEL